MMTTYGGGDTGDRMDVTQGRLGFNNLFVYKHRSVCR